MLTKIQLLNELYNFGLLFSSIKHNIPLHHQALKLFIHQKKIMQNNLNESSPLQKIKSIQQTLNILKNKICQMSKKQSQNAQQIQKVFYSSIPVLKTKLSQTFLYQKVKNLITKTNKKKYNNFNDSILKQRVEINRQRKLINQKQIQRNRELITIMKMNERNSIKQLSKKNELYIQKMKNQILQQKKKKKEIVKGNIENSRMKVKNFHQVKLQELRKQKQQQITIIQKKADKMMIDLKKLHNKQNQTHEKIQKSSEALMQLRFAVNKLSKMNDEQFIKLRNNVKKQVGTDNEEKIIQKLLTTIIQNSKQKRLNTTNSKWNSRHLQKIA